jgi:tetratricopeptide (TPR) repeat protein
LDTEPDPALAGTSAEYVAKLAELRAWAGEPSLRRLRLLGGRTQTTDGDEVDTLPVSTLSHVLTGKTLPKLPRMAFVDAFVGACLTAAGVTDQSERLAAWRAAWRALHNPAPELDGARQLPMDIGEFTGRQAELDRIEEIVAASPGVPVIVIEGMAGVGKTRLAVHAAHQLAASGRFDQVQLWSDLRGFDPRQRPADPGDVLESFLRLLGVPGAQISRNTAERSIRYRDLLAGRRAVVVLDNVASEEQVTPLLPGAPGCVVLITTRHRLAGLAGAHRLSLDVFSHAETTALLATIAGPERMDDEAGVRRIAARCGHLPMLLALAARRLHARPAWRLSDLAEVLEASGDSAASSFELSYRSLDPVRQRVFRLLGLHPGRDVTAASAAALTGVGPAVASAALEALLDDHLVQQETAGRYHFHDLLRGYARELTAATDDDAERERALRECVTWYLHTADRAAQVLAPHRRRNFTLPPTEAAVPEFADYAAALAWCEAERANLVAATHAAADAGLPDLAWRLPAVLLWFFYRRSHWADWLDTHQVALDAARTAGDRRGEATIRNSLGVAYDDLRLTEDALANCAAAAALFEEIGDHWAIAWCFNNMGVTCVNAGDSAAAAAHFQRALPLFRRSEDAAGEAICLNNLGDSYRHLGRPTEAIACLHEALDLQADDPAGRRYTLGTLGELYRDISRYDEAERQFRAALAAHEEVGDRRGTARTHRLLAETLKALNRPTEATPHETQATQIQSTLTHPTP